MSDETARLLYDGARALVAGRRDEARELLLRAVELDEQNAEAWLWLSGAVDDPADQQVALENVLAVDPGNARAREGLAILRLQGGPAATSEIWPLPPTSPDVDDMQLHCWKCGGRIYAVATFCWQCHAAIHCCNNCRYRDQTRCKAEQGLLPAAAHVVQNQCPWWMPKTE